MISLVFAFKEFHEIQEDSFTHQSQKHGLKSLYLLPLLLQKSLLSTNLQNYNEDKASVGGELDAVLAYLDKLKPECEVKVMSYEEKVARREAEIDGLKEALGILEGEDIPALIQVKAHLRR